MTEAKNKTRGRYSAALQAADPGAVRPVRRFDQRELSHGISANVVHK